MIIINDQIIKQFNNLDNLNKVLVVMSCHAVLVVQYICPSFETLACMPLHLKVNRI